MTKHISESGLYGQPGAFPLSRVSKLSAQAISTSGLKDGDKSDDKISAKKVKIPAKSLKPAQKEIVPGKALAIAVRYLMGAPIDLSDLGAIVSSDNYIMDGHHRWAAAFLLDPNTKLTVTKIDLKGEELITVLNYLTVGKLGIMKGNKGKGNVSDFTGAKISPIINDLMQNGDYFKGTHTPPEDFMAALTKVSGANGDPFKGRDILLKRADQLPKSVMPGAPSRVNMPVILPSRVAVVASMIKNGVVDIKAPYSDEVKRALGLRESLLKRGYGSRKNPINEATNPLLALDKNIRYFDKMRTKSSPEKSFEFLKKTFDKYEGTLSNIEDKFVKLINGSLRKFKKSPTKFIHGLKPFDSIVDKVIVRGKQLTKISDLVRGALLFKFQEDMEDWVNTFRRKYAQYITEYDFKAKGKDPNFGYYGSHHIDLNIDGLTVELQITTWRLWNYKFQAHNIYKKYGSGKSKPDTFDSTLSKKLFSLGNKAPRRESIEEILALYESLFGRRSLITERKDYTHSSEIFEDYLRGELSIQDLIEYSDRIGRAIATLDEIDSFLKNNFAQKIKAEELGVTVPQMVKRLKELRKALFKG